MCNKIQLRIISNFLKKLLSLKIQFFESHLIGDILRRVEDHKKIERLLTVTSLSTVFSVINLILFSIILLMYDTKIFGIFFIGFLKNETILRCNPNSISPHFYLLLTFLSTNIQYFQMLQSKGYLEH